MPKTAIEQSHCYKTFIVIFNKTFIVYQAIITKSDTIINEKNINNNIDVGVIVRKVRAKNEEQALLKFTAQTEYIEAIKKLKPEISDYYYLRQIF